MLQNVAKRRIHSPMTFRRGMRAPLLTFRDVSVRRGQKTVLENVNFELHPGECVALFGENGCGKSTFLEVAARLHPIERGSVLHDEEVVIDADGRRKKSPLTLGLCLQKNGAMGQERVQDRLEVAMSQSRHQVVSNPFLEAFNLTHRAQDALFNLSQGQQRKVAVLAGLLPAFSSPNPTLIILDEPDAGLDEAAVNQLIKWLTELRQLGHAILISTHHQPLLSIASKIYDFKTLQTTAQEQANGELTTIIQSATPRITPMRFGLKHQLITMKWLESNVMAGLLALGVMLTFGGLPFNTSSMIGIGFILTPAFAAGLCGDGLTRMLQEEHANDWWRAVASPPHSGILPILFGTMLTLSAQLALFNEWTLSFVLIGGIISLVTSHLVRLLAETNQRLSRPNAALIGLLTPILILPFALLLDALA